jgi:UDP-2-acetamido-3-amino-2,3-dideoxy-glucuronate N-acetyltransferase
MTIENKTYEYEVHSSSFIDSGAKIGRGTTIWHFTHVCGGASIGQKCSLGQNVFVGNDVKIGNNVKIQNNVSVYDAVTLEDDVFCGPSMVFTNVYNPRSHIVRKSEYRSTYVEKGATIGANATIICGVRIGKYAFIGAGAVINSDVPSYAVMVGVPARQIGWMCTCGVALKFTTNVENVGHATCAICNSKYTIIAGNCVLQND